MWMEAVHRNIHRENQGNLPSYFTWKQAEPKLFRILKYCYSIHDFLTTLFFKRDEFFFTTGGMQDACQIDNGGCEHICYNKCGRETSCSCLPGYRLAYDGKSCIGKNSVL